MRLATEADMIRILRSNARRAKNRRVASTTLSSKGRGAVCPVAVCMRIPPEKKGAGLPRNPRGLGPVKSEDLQDKSQPILALFNYSILTLKAQVPGAGLEPASLAAQHLKCCEFTNFSTRAKLARNIISEFGLSWKT